MLKADERFLYVLLTLSQEKNIKTGRFPLIYADECVISHTNETEFNEFLGNKKSEALHDRMIMVRIPYNLKVSQEERIYQKLLRATSLEGVHIAPHTLRVAAIFAVLSRLEEPKMHGLTLLKKLRLYDGEDVDGFRQKDVKQIKEQTEREGMDGISPRFIINRVSASLIKPDTRCINPIDVLRALKDGIEQQSQFKKADRERYANLIADARREYDEIARTDVQKAFFVSFEKEALTLLDNYLDNVEAYLDQSKLIDPITGEQVPPNEKLLRSIEEKVQVPEHPHLTVVWCACHENGGPGILPLGTFPNATRRIDAWTPQQHSAPIWPAPPEAKPARATLASTRARTSAFSARRVTRRSVPRKARHSTACGRQPKPSLSCSRSWRTAVPCKRSLSPLGLTSGPLPRGGPAPGDRGRLSRSIWWNNHATWDRSKPMRSA